MTQSYPSRPPLNRGRTLPAYLARELVSQPGQAPSATPEKGSQSTLLDNTRSNASDRTDPNRDYSQSVPGSPLQGHHHWQSVLPPTPPSTSPGSEEMYAQSPFSSYSSSSSSSSNSSGSAATATNAPTLPRTYRFSVPARSAVSDPSLASSPSAPSATSFILRCSRVPSSHDNIHVFFEAGETNLSFSAPIGPGFDTACITVSARKNNCVDIVADRWEVNRDCRFEWNVQFTSDADMSRIKAQYEGGLLSVVAPRKTMYQPPYRGRPTPYPSGVANYRRS